jgi:hypothetical protein
VATNKNQHFVPRCYLRQFTIDGADRAINLYNIDRDKFVERAPVKSQCSGDYFYGKDSRLDKAIKTVEDSYGAAVREILQPGYLLTDEHCTLLKLFWLLQHLRTEAASRRAVEMTDAMAPLVDPDDTGFRMQIREAVQIAMSTFAESMRVVSDLKVCLIRNRSNVPFVTSDDPAVLTNRWHLQNAKRNVFSFGLHSAGTLLILPLSPSVLCLAYDSDMHSVPQLRGWTDLKNDADADAFNQHQYLNCRANIFVRDTVHFEAIRDAFQRVSKLRPPARHRIHYAVLDETNGEYSRYVVVDPEKAEPHERALIHSQIVYATPAAWPRQIKWRTGASAFSNGTGIGYIRRAFTHIDNSSPFKKVRVFPV